MLRNATGKFPNVNDSDHQRAFLLPLDYNGDELEFEMRIQQGYVQRIEVIVDGITVVFEPGKELNYRAVIDTGQLSPGRTYQYQD